MDEDLLARVDSAAMRTDTKRARWIARACEMRLGLDEFARDYVEPSLEAGRPAYRQSVPGPNVENIRDSARAKRDVQPIPKRGK